MSPSARSVAGHSSSRTSAQHLKSSRSSGLNVAQLRRQSQAVRQLAIKAISAPSSADIKNALRNVKPQLLINGKFVDASSGKTFPTENPATKETLIEVAEGSAEDVEAAIDAARDAFDKGPWPRMTGRQRGEILFKLADLMEENIDELAMLETLDNGKPFKYARTSDLPQAIEHIRYYAGYADKVHGKTIPCNGKMMAYTYREPLGVIGQIIPWNFPILMMAWKIGPALAMGNTIVMKVAEQTPLSALRVGELALDAGLPAGCLNLVLGDGPVAGAALSKSKRVQKLAFTGSTEVGKIIMKQAAENIVPVTLELGGKSPNIICPDADIDEAVEGAHFALFFNMGQCCTAGSRTFVHADIYDEFVSKARERAMATNVGDPFGEGTELGPQISKEQLDIILGFVEKGKAEGAKLECGGKMKEGTNGYYLEPTVFSGVTDDMTIARDEIFGPVQSILKWNTIEEVIERSNSNEYGLAAGVWTKNLNWMNSLSRGVQSGTIWVNCYDVFDAAVPFGGYKLSGIGREHGDEVLGHYTQVKSVYVPLEDPIGWNA